MHAKLNDVDLIQMTLDGDQSAYGELVKRYQRYVFTLALRFTRNRENAEEIAQDCFIKTYRSLNTFKRSSKFSTWLYSIVYTTSMTFLRKKQLETIPADSGESVSALENYPSQYENRAENNSQSFYLNKAIEQLLADDAAIITLFYISEQSVEEVAGALNMSQGTIKVKLHRARHRLREKLEQLLKDEVKDLL